VARLEKIIRVVGDIIINLLMPGLTQIAYGKIKRGIVLYLLFHVVVLASVFIALQPLRPFNIILPIFIFASVYFFIIIDGLLCAMKPENKLNMQPVLSVVLVVGLLIIDSSFVETMIKKLVKENIAEAFHIPAVAMYPSLMPGDFILVSKLPNNREPNREDIVVFHSPSDAHRTLIKRVVGLSGESIEVKDNNLYISNIKQLEDYAADSLPVDSPEKEAPKNFGPATARENSFFVLSDNRNYGQDGRSWGFLDKDEIIGKAATIYWSWDKETHSIRWDRIGKAIK
jgi:signal peptidase I